MLDEGLYGLRYRSADQAEPDRGEGLAVLRDGKILGSDRWGGVFAGTCEYDAKRDSLRVRARLELPPDSVLITGFRAGPGGATLDVVGVVESASASPAALVDVGGQPIAVELTFLGPLPV
jgi:hypothetical protein